MAPLSGEGWPELSRCCRCGREMWRGDLTWGAGAERGPASELHCFDFIDCLRWQRLSGKAGA